jgi:NRE family putative nickel resistance protein-like MFS transporter
MGNASIRQALLLSLAEAAAGACAIVVTVAYVRDVLGGTEVQFSMVMACVGFGSAATAVLLSRSAKKRELQSADSASLHVSQHRWAALTLLLDHCSVESCPMLVSSILYFQRKITGSALICSK